MEENIKRLKKDNSEYIFQLKNERENTSESELLKLPKKDVKELEIENYCKTDEINFELLKEHNKVKFISKDFEEFVIRKLTFYDINSKKVVNRYSEKVAFERIKKVYGKIKNKGSLKYLKEKFE